MATNYRTPRNVELSLLEYLDANLVIDWPGTSVKKTFAEVYAKDTNLPAVCVRLADTASVRREVGNTTLDDTYLLIIDIFAKHDGMRLDLADYIKQKLALGWQHYTFANSSGSNETLEKTASGRDMVNQWLTDARIDFFDTVDIKDKYRHNISVRVKYSSP